MTLKNSEYGKIVIEFLVKAVALVILPFIGWTVHEVIDLRVGVSVCFTAEQARKMTESFSEAINELNKLTAVIEARQEELRSRIDRMGGV